MEALTVCTSAAAAGSKVQLDKRLLFLHQAEPTSAVVEGLKAQLDKNYFLYTRPKHANCKRTMFGCTAI